MLYIRKLISVILSASICLLLFAGSVSAASQDVGVEEMASALNKLNILQGSNGDYLLNNQLDRAQAVTLIIRMLGKNEYVLENADEMRYTKFSDVNAQAWYAPYVGYSTQNDIVGGKPDGSFAPTEYITEKAFIKMALCALGYVYAEDFDWTNVYQKAYDIGIVTDPSYEARTQDNVNYLRSDAVKILYHSLNAYKNGTQTKMVYTLVEEGVLTNDAVADSGILNGKTIAEIETISALAPNNIEIVFSEVIQSVNIEDVSIIDNKTESKLDVKSIGISGKTIQIITAGQTPGSSYTVEIQSVTDVNGNISKKISEIFKGYMPVSITSDFFKISKLEQTSENIINVFFTHPINLNAETPIYYQLLEDGSDFVTGSAQNMTVKRLQSTDNAVSIALKDMKLKRGVVYTLNVSGKLASAYGVRLGEGEGEEKDFVASHIEREEFGILSVKASSADSVLIRFTREADMVWAGKRLNYTVLDPDKDEIDVVEAIVGDNEEYLGREILLKLGTSLRNSGTYKVIIDYIPDVYKQSTIEGVEVSFSGAYPREIPLAIKRIINERNNIVEVIFNKALDPVSAEKVSNYLIRGNNDISVSTDPHKAFYSEKNGEYSVKLFLPSGVSFSNKKKYFVYVSGMKDKMGQVEQSVFQKEFTANRVGAGKPVVVDAVTISKDTIKLTFDVEIAFSPTNIGIDNYTLEYEYDGETLRLAPVAVNYINAETLVLRFDELDPSVSYKLRFKALTDYSEVYTRTDADGDNLIDVRFGS